MGTSRSARIRVLVVGLPRVLTDIITETIATQRDMELVPDQRSIDLRSHARQSGTDAVIAGLVDDELTPDCEDLIWMRPPLPVLGVAARGGRAVLYQVRPHVTELGEVSVEELLAATRAAARPLTADRG